MPKCTVPYACVFVLFSPPGAGLPSPPSTNLSKKSGIRNETAKFFFETDSAGETDRRPRQGRRAGRQAPVPLFACRRFETGYLVGNLQSPPEMQKPCVSSIHKVFARLPSFAGLYERETETEPFVSFRYVSI